MWFKRLKEKTTDILGGATLLALLALVFYFYPPVVRDLLFFLDNSLYDMTVRNFPKPIKSKTPITIVDIDDRSLSVEGRWPWPREKLAELVNKLYQAGAVVIAFDIEFSEAEENAVNQILPQLKKEGTSDQILQQLQTIKNNFEFDQTFAKALSAGESVLPMVFFKEGISRGVLPAPFLTLTEADKHSLLIPFYPVYLSNIPVLQAATKKGGFINASLDSDGIIRRSYLLLGHENSLYGSLALAAASLFLLEDQIDLIIQNYQGQKVLEGVQFGELFIPTDPWGRVLVPFRGPSYTFPYVSATDILHDHFSKDKIENRLIFIGSSSTGWKDFFATAAAPIFPGVEIHASIAAGIMDRYFPISPTWGKGLLLLIMILIGIPLIFIFSTVGPIPSTLILLATSTLLVFLQVELWVKYGFFLSMLGPMMTIFLLFLFLELYGYFSEARRKKELREVFGQYVPVQHIDRMIQKTKAFDLEGENKELTVFFSDIRDFTPLAEKLSAPEVKQLLNEYLTAMTQVIFDHAGTIDKYVGDMIMAFWGAPLPDEKHALHAVQTALAMQKKLNEMREGFKQRNLELRIGIGINTGWMNVGDMGSKFRRAYTVLGDAVNTAARMESITKLYHVPNIVAHATVEQTKTEIVYRLLDKVRLKGKEQATYLYEAICSRAELMPAMQEKLQLHHQALDHYWKREWDQAEGQFKALVQKDPERKELYTLYLARIKTFRKAPLDAQWDGVYILESK